MDLEDIKKKLYMETASLDHEAYKYLEELKEENSKEEES